MKPTFASVCPVLSVMLCSASADGDEKRASASPSVSVAAAGRTLVVYRQVSPAVRRVAAKKRLPGPAVHVVRKGRHVYVACGASGFVIVDISDPRRPRTVGSAAGIGNVRGLEVRAELLVVSVGRYQFRAFDVKDPSKLAPLSLAGMADRLEAWLKARPPRLRPLPTDPVSLGKRHLKNLPDGARLPGSMLRGLPGETRPARTVPSGPRPRLIGLPSGDLPVRPRSEKGSLRFRVLDVRFTGDTVPRGRKGPLRSRVLDVRFSGEKPDPAGR